MKLVKYLLTSFYLHLFLDRWDVLLCEIRLWNLLDDITVMTVTIQATIQMADFRSGYIYIIQSKPSCHRQSLATEHYFKVFQHPTSALCELHGNNILSYLGHGNWQVNYAVLSLQINDTL